jgi:hypothetical protein
VIIVCALPAFPPFPASDPDGDSDSNSDGEGKDQGREVLVRSNCR